jgi:hypothetical protein
VIHRPYLRTPIPYRTVSYPSHAVLTLPTCPVLSNLREGSLSLRPLFEILGPASQTSQL